MYGTVGLTEEETMEYLLLVSFFVNSMDGILSAMLSTVEPALRLSER